VREGSLNLYSKVTYGPPREARLDWKIRQVTKDIFKYPLDVVGQNIENIIDECIIREISPVVCNIYCNSEELIIEDFIGMTPEDVENNYVTFGVTGKSRVFGRYGHGGKDTALAIAGYFHLLSRVGNNVCAYKIWEDKESLAVKYNPAWGLESHYPKIKDGTLIIIPNTQHFTLEEIKEYVMKHFFLGLVEERIIIGLGEHYGSRTEVLQAKFPLDCEVKRVRVEFEREGIEKYCREPPLKQLPEVRGFYLVPKEGYASQPGYNIYSYGKFITCVPSSINGVGHFEIDFLPETTELTASKDLKLGRQSLYQRHLLPKLMEWEKSNLRLKETENELEFIQEIEALLGPLYGGSKKQTKRKRKLKQIKRPVEFKVQVTPNPGQTPGHGKLNLIDEPGQPLVVGIQLPDKIFINRGNPDGKYIWGLDRQTKKTLIYSRAAIFLPFVQKSKSGTPTSTELNRIHEEALKSQEFWMNAIRRDHGDKQEVRYLGGKTVIVKK